MSSKFLFPHRFKKVGFVILIPSMVFGLVVLINDYEPKWLDINWLSVEIFDLKSKSGLIQIINNNYLNEILCLTNILGALFVAFSKEKIEDEYILKIRLESLVWAVYFNYLILVFAILFVFDFSFLYVLIFNMFTILLFFIIRFNWKLIQLRKS